MNKFWTWISNWMSWKKAYNKLCIRVEKEMDDLNSSIKYLQKTINIKDSMIKKMKGLLGNAYNAYGNPIDEDDEI